MIFGLFGLAGMVMALPLDALQEVVPCPPHLTPLPVPAAGLLGAMNLRSLVLPVVDLRPQVGLEATRNQDGKVVVVTVEDQMMGLLIDEVREVLDLDVSSLMQMSTGEGDLFFTHTFPHPETGDAVCVLDAAAIVRSVGLPSLTVDRATGRARAAVVSEGVAPPGLASDSHSQTIVVVDCGPVRLGLELAQVRTTLLTAAPRASVVSGGLCRGMVDVSGVDLPVVDPLAVLGLGMLPEDEPTGGVVLDVGRGALVLAVTSLVALATVNGREVLPAPAMALPRADLLHGLVDLGDGGQVLLLDTSRLIEEADLASLAAIGAGGGDLVDDTRRALGGASYLVFRAGRELTSPLDQVAEVLALPTSLVAPDGMESSLGIAVHRGRAVPVMSLSSVLGFGPTDFGAATCLLLVDLPEECGSGQVALVVDELDSIQPLAWTDPDQRRQGDCQGNLHAMVSTAPLVQVGSDTRLLPAVSLLEVALMLVGMTAYPSVSEDRHDDHPSDDFSGQPLDPEPEWLDSLAS